MARYEKRNSAGRPVRLIILGLVGLAALIMVLWHGNNVTLLNPKGSIAHEQLGLVMFCVGLLLTIAVPAVALLYFTAWKYRDSNTKATYAPEMRHGAWFNVGIWAIPSVFMLVLALVMWSATHRLEPQKAIVAQAKPMIIQVVALRWKWLFIYPEQKIATVNFVQIPTDTPVTFELTADDTPMSSFWIPNLGGMLYAMTGHVNRLNLMAQTPGDYPGSSAEINGAGFAGMKFTARASSKEDFDVWVQDTQLSPGVLDEAEYNKLLQPSEKNPAAFYSAPEVDIYDKVLMKYMGSHDGHM